MICSRLFLGHSSRTSASSSDYTTIQCASPSQWTLFGDATPWGLSSEASNLTSINSMSEPATSQPSFESPTSLCLDADFRSSDRDTPAKARGSTASFDTDKGTPGTGCKLEDTLPKAVNSMRPVKRRRGRPRKYPLILPECRAKISMPRSKTGCVTCRRRKKKCDETKPHCLNCQKNAAVCEGYPEKHVWKSGKERVDAARGVCTILRPKDLPRLIRGIESDIDQYLCDHFAAKLSAVLTLRKDDNNPFRQVLLPMAVRSEALMHAVLSLASSHVMDQNPKAFEERQAYHFTKACNILRRDPKLSELAVGKCETAVDDDLVAAMLILTVNSICRGENNGEYRPHLAAVRHFITADDSTSQTSLQIFLVEYFQYHDSVNCITSLDCVSRALAADQNDPQSYTTRYQGTMLGVVDGLFGYLRAIAGLRQRIRTRRRQESTFLYEDESLRLAVLLARDIQSWPPDQERGSTRYLASRVYQVCTWLYLYRTIKPSRPCPKLRRLVDIGLDYVRQLPKSSATQSLMLLPVFLLGCSAFAERQRRGVREAFGTLKTYSDLRNIDLGRKVVERIWVLMDMDDQDSWDWEMIVSEMGYDFLVT